MASQCSCACLCNVADAGTAAGAAILTLCLLSCRAHKAYLDARVSFARRKDQSYVQQVCERGERVVLLFWFVHVPASSCGTARVAAGNCTHMLTLYMQHLSM
jgi:hypothetical protein